MEYLWNGAIEAEGKQPASDRKRRRIRLKGRTVSTPLSGAVVGVGWFLLAALIAAAPVGRGVTSLARDAWSFSSADLDPLGILRQAAVLALVVAGAGLMVPMAVCLLVGAQVGFAWTGPMGADDDEGAFVSRLFTGFVPSRLLIALAGGGCLILVAIVVGAWSWPLAGFVVRGDAALNGARTMALRFLGIIGALFVAMIVIAVVDYLFRRRRFEVSIAMTTDEIRREAWEDEGRPEVVSARDRRAREILQGATPDLVVIGSSGRGIVLGRRGGRGTPIVVSRFSARDRLVRAAVLSGRGVAVVFESRLFPALEALRDGQDLPEPMFDDVVALYRRAGVQVAGGQNV